MTKLCSVIILCAALVLIPFAAYAAPVGNIAKPAMLKSLILSKGNDEATFGVIAEGEFDFVNEINVKDDPGGSDSELGFLGGKLGLTLFKKFVIYGTLAGAWYEESFTDEGSSVKIESDKDISYGVGATAILYEKELSSFDNSILRLGVDGRFRFTDVDVDKVIIGGVTYTLPSGSVSNMSLEYSDWHIAGEVSLQWKRLIPYFGVRYFDFDSTAKATVSGTTYEDTGSKPKSHVGVFVGTDLVVFDSMSLNVEGRFIDEEAITVGCAVQF